MKNIKIISNDDFENGYWESDYDEYEEVYKNSLMMVQIIEQNRKLKRENARLNQELAEYRKKLDKQYKFTQTQAANLLSTLINKEDEKQVKR